MKEIYEVSLYFITDDVTSTALITDSIQLVPTDEWSDANAGGSFWNYAATDAAKNSIDSALNGLLDNLMDKKARFSELAGRWKIGILCVCFFADLCPAYHISAEVIRKCAELNLGLRFELFCFDEEEQLECYLNRRQSENKSNSNEDTEVDRADWQLEEEFDF